MTKISQDDVIKLARLSGVKLKENEIERLGRDIEAVLEYVKQLDELDVTNVEPAYQVTGLTNVFRSDIAELDGDMKQTLLALAPDASDDYVKVPKVL